MRSDAEANRREILAAAARLIAEQGTGVSLRTIAQEAGVGIGTLYRHFATREDLLVGLVQSIFERIDATAEEFAREAVTAETWRTYVAQIAAMNVGALASALREGHDVEHLDSLGARREQTMAGVGRVLEAACVHGLIRDDVTTPRFLLGVIQYTRPLPADAPEELSDELPWLLDAFVRALRP